MTLPASASEQTAVEFAVFLFPVLAAEQLSLRLGGEEVHLALGVFFALMSEPGSEEKLLGRSDLAEASGSWSGLMVRGSGFTSWQTGCVVSCPAAGSAAMASEVKMTLKCVFSEGVMVKVFGSDLSFLLTYRRTK